MYYIVRDTRSQSVYDVEQIALGKYYEWCNFSEFVSLVMVRNDGTEEIIAQSW